MIPMPSGFIKVNYDELTNTPGVLIIGKPNGTLVAYSLLAKECFDRHVSESNRAVWPIYLHSSKDCGEVFEQLKGKYQGISYQGAFSVPQ